MRTQCEQCNVAMGTSRVEVKKVWKHPLPQGRDFSDQAGNIFKELGDKEGLQMVDEAQGSNILCSETVYRVAKVMYLASNVAVERYCEAWSSVCSLGRK